MSKAMPAIVGGVAAMVGFMAMVAVGASSHQPRRDMTVADILDKLAAAANDIKGQEVGPNVFVDSATVEDGKRLTYYYTVPNATKGDIDRKAADKAKRLIREQACDNRMMRKAMDDGAVINYFYRNQAGDTLFTIRVSERICTKLA